MYSSSIVAALLGLVAGVARADTIAEIATSTEGFSTLVAAAKAAGLVDALNDPESTLTVLAPTDDAFAKLGLDADSVAEVDPDMLSHILLYHVLGEEVTSEDVAASVGGEVETLYGDALTIADGPSFNTTSGGSASIEAVDIAADGGIIHVIDTVMVPADLVQKAIAVNESEDFEGAFDTLIAAVIEAELVDALTFPEGPYTVFAPIDDAFDVLEIDADGIMLLDPFFLDILLTHVAPGILMAEDVLAAESIETLSGATLVPMVEGENVYVEVEGGSKAMVIVTDVKAANGVIHAIDSVLLEADIPATAIAAGEDFETLVAAVVVTDLADPLSFPNGPFTVFAPIESAWTEAGLDAETVSSITDEETLETLANTLTFHVISGAYSADDLVEVGSLDHHKHENILDTIRSDGAYLAFGTTGKATPAVFDGEGNKVPIVASVKTLNGYVHVIESILVPSPLNGPALKHHKSEADTAVKKATGGDRFL